jgi:hypothetical protein
MTETEDDMIDEKIGRVKALIQKREEIDAELNAIFSGAAPAKRGAYSEATVMPIGRLVKLPDFIDDETGCRGHASEVADGQYRRIAKRC